MSKHSVSPKWEVHYNDTTSYYFYHHKHGGLFSMNLKRVENLNSIIHEINECEVIYALINIDFTPDSVIHITKKMCKKYPWLFIRPAKEIYITHIISPYGKGNCALPRRKNRVIF